MRARLAIHASGLTVELREVALRNKPACMLAASPKGSVPVLILPDQSVIDESWDIMQWALNQHDPEEWQGQHGAYTLTAKSLVNSNDNHFKKYLDRYKYADRYPEQSRHDYRTQGEVFLQQLETRLCATRYLLADTHSIADAAILPFIRQFAEVDKDWFAQAPYPALRNWLQHLLLTPRFVSIMQKYSPWKAGDAPIMMGQP